MPSLGTDLHVQCTALCSQAPTCPSPLTPVPRPTGKQQPGTTRPRPITPRITHASPKPPPRSVPLNLQRKTCPKPQPRGVPDVKQRHHLRSRSQSKPPPTRRARNPHLPPWLASQTRYLGASPSVSQPANRISVSLHCRTPSRHEAAWTRRLEGGQLCGPACVSPISLSAPQPGPAVRGI